MDLLTRPFRSLLYMPGSKERALEKATQLPCDGIILDLEDAVAPEDKANARNLVCDTLLKRDYGQRSLIVRINGFETDWSKADLAAVCATGPAAILLPKVNAASDITRLAGVLDAHPKCGETAIWAMMETPLGVLNAASIASASARLKGMVMGTNDLVKDLGARHTPTRAPVLASLSLCLLAARAHGLICVDGVYNKYKDDDGLRSYCQQGRDMGFDGKTLIHPAQIAVTNAVFAPSDDELSLARRQMEAFRQAKANGLGIAVLDGAIVENLHIEAARHLLARDAAIRAMSEI